MLCKNMFWEKQETYYNCICTCPSVGKYIMYTNCQMAQNTIT